MRVVLDTNVWISGLLWRGAPWRVLRLAEEGRIEVCTVPSMLEELFGVLDRPKFRARLQELDLSKADLRARVLPMVTLFEEHQPATVGPIVAADPDDDVFLLCALEAEAECVVSGDAPLLQIGEHQGILILSVQDFLSRYFPNIAP